MKIFSAAQIREWDAYTIENEPITSLELMNRAARVFTDWLIKTCPDQTRPIAIIAGTGNNGGDGLAVARMLDQAQFAPKVVVCDFGGRHSADFRAQLGMIPEFSPVRPFVCKSFAAFKEKSAEILSPNALVVDALFGSGLSRPLAGDWAPLVGFLNEAGNEIVSIDLPSGLFSDISSLGNPVIKAWRTLTFETPKRAFFLPENAGFLGQWACASIGLHPEFAAKAATGFRYLLKPGAEPLRRARAKFSHKGSYGHALIIAGSYGKMGAAVLAARACLRAGTGLLTVHAPRCGNSVLQTSVPEAMASTDRHESCLSEVPVLDGYSGIGIGPGIGLSTETARALHQLLSQTQMPLVLDADALNLIAANQAWLGLLPQNTILTPHPKEFERLFGKMGNDFERLDLLLEKARQHQIFIVLKGAHTAIACPDGECWFNSSGNPGMATGGTGDALTGVVTGLVAQGYGQKEACLLGVYLHGLAGDLAAAACSQEAMTAGDLVACLGAAWQKLG